MAKTITCPKCGKVGITVNVSQFYDIEFAENSTNGFPSRVVCENCKKILRYKTVKKTPYVAKNDN